MTIRTSSLVLATLTFASLSALAPTSASAWESYGHQSSAYYGGHHSCDYCAPSRPVYYPSTVYRPAYRPVYRPFYVPTYRPVYQPTTAPCDCEMPARPVYVPPRRVYVPVPVAAPCDCEAPARPVYVPRPQVYAPVTRVPVETTAPCDCEAPAKPVYIPRRTAYAPVTTAPVDDCEEPAKPAYEPREEGPEQQDREVKKQMLQKDKVASYASTELKKN